MQNFKPLIYKLKELNQKLYWLIPVARNSHKLIDMNLPQDEIIDDIEEVELKFACKHSNERLSTI